MTLSISKTYLKSILLACGIVFLAGCTSLEVLAPPVDKLFVSEAELNASQTAELRKGREIYLDFCTECHRARRVDEITPGNWKRHIPKMFKKAELYPEEKRLLTAYLKTAGKINPSLIKKRK